LKEEILVAGYLSLHINQIDRKLSDFKNESVAFTEEIGMS